VSFKNKDIMSKDSNLTTGEVSAIVDGAPDKFKLLDEYAQAIHLEDTVWSQSIALTTLLRMIIRLAPEKLPEERMITSFAIPDKGFGHIIYIDTSERNFNAATIERISHWLNDDKYLGTPKSNFLFIVNNITPYIVEDGTADIANHVLFNLNVFFELFNFHNPVVFLARSGQGGMNMPTSKQVEQTKQVIATFTEQLAAMIKNHHYTFRYYLTSDINTAVSLLTTPNTKELPNIVSNPEA
jgi:hypothetical protein